MSSSMQTAKIILISLDENFVNYSKQQFPANKYSNFEHKTCDVQSLLPATEETGGQVFVSPANSLGYMDGGIDYIYSRKMFKGCEQKLKDLIKQSNQTTQLGRPYLRVGSAIWFPTTELISGEIREKLTKEQPLALLCAPTMFLPHDVSETNNAYWAFMAILIQFDKIRKIDPKYRTLICPSLCCGYGKMLVETAVNQMKKAYDDFIEGKVPKEEHITGCGLEYTFLPSIDHEQPKNFDNREIGVSMF